MTESVASTRVTNLVKNNASGDLKSRNGRVYYTTTAQTTQTNTHTNYNNVTYETTKFNLGANETISFTTPNLVELEYGSVSGKFHTPSPTYTTQQPTQYTTQTTMNGSDNDTQQAFFSLAFNADYKTAFNVTGQVQLQPEETDTGGTLYVKADGPSANISTSTPFFVSAPGGAGTISTATMYAPNPNGTFVNFTASQNGATGVTVNVQGTASGYNEHTGTETNTFNDDLTGHVELEIPGENIDNNASDTWFGASSTDTVRVDTQQLNDININNGTTIKGRFDGYGRNPTISSAHMLIEGLATTTSKTYQYGTITNYHTASFA